MANKDDPSKRTVSESVTTPDRALTTAQVAKVLSVSTETVKRMIKSGSLASFTVNSRRRVWWSEVVGYAERNREGGK